MWSLKMGRDKTQNRNKELELGIKRELEIKCSIGDKAKEI